MSLPNITIPAVNIPFDIPTLLHPALVHFAIAIPVLIVVAEFINLFINSKGMKVMTSLMMFLLVVIFFGAYLTGSADAKAATDSGFGAMDELKEHKLLGIYIFYASIFVFILKLISLAVSKAGFKAFYMLVLIGFLAGVLHQGKEGGELVYKHGANVKISDEMDDDEDENIQKKAPTAVEEKVEKKDGVTPPSATTQTKEDTKEEAKTTILDEKKEDIKKSVDEKKEELTKKADEAVKEALDINKTEH